MSAIKKERVDFTIGAPEKVAAAIILIIMTLTMFYADITVTARFSMTFLDSLFDGKFASFYMNALETGIAPEGAVYDIGIYIVFAVWGIPVWGLNKLWGIDVMSVGCLLWFKLLLILFTLGTILLLKKIAIKLGFSDKISQYVCYLSGISLLFVFPILVAAQYDIVPVFFMMYGILGWMEQDKKRCLLGFSIAFTMKPIAILTYGILLLLEEKRIRYIILKAVVSLIPVFICKGIYLLNPLNSDSNNIFLAGVVSDLLKVSVPAGNGGFSLCFLVGALIYIAAYMEKLTDNVERNGKKFIWFAFLLWADFSLFLEIAPYWIVYLAPFLVLVLFFNERKINQSLLLDFVVNTGVIFSMIVSFSWVYGGEKTFSYLILRPIYQMINQEEIPTVCGTLRRFQLTMFQPVINSVVIAAVIFVAYLSYRGMKEENDKEEIVIENWHIRIRIIILYGWTILCLLMLAAGSISLNF
ncbi:hypothetical protein [Parablautia muri]|uniref:Uncharacterized protein n=1 Tax=Parablautia muri TaxID=2320879 RepID=A0A9X5BE73_9FIRM|nr:hypothetical protein [Parablautia muri]NBJ92114.1 hypothetical protein [Parablautia muri]